MLNIYFVICIHWAGIDQNPGYLLYTRDEILPSYIGIIISQYKDPYTPTRIQWNCHTRWAPGASFTWSEKPPISMAWKKIGCAWGDFTVVIGVISPKLYPIGSMYGIFTYIWLISMVNVGKYTIHGSYGYVFFGHTLQGFWPLLAWKKQCCIAPQARGPNRPEVLVVKHSSKSQCDVPSNFDKLKDDDRKREATLEICCSWNINCWFLRICWNIGV